MMGVSSRNIVIAENGTVIEFTKKGVLCSDTVPSGAVLVDGSGGIGEVGSVVMRDRHKLAEDGMIVVVLTYSSLDHKLLAEPEILTRGFIYVKDSEDLIEEMKQVAVLAVETCKEQEINDISAIKSKVKSSVASFLFKKTKCSPIVLPVIFEV